MVWPISRRCSRAAGEVAAFEPCGMRMVIAASVPPVVSMTAVCHGHGIGYPQTIFGWSRSGCLQVLTAQERSSGCTRSCLFVGKSLRHSGQPSG